MRIARGSTEDRPGTAWGPPGDRPGIALGPSTDRIGTAWLHMGPLGAARGLANICAIAAKIVFLSSGGRVFTKQKQLQSMDSEIIKIIPPWTNRLSSQRGQIFESSLCVKMRVTFGRWEISDRNCLKNCAPARARRSILQNIGSRARETTTFSTHRFGHHRIYVFSQIYHRRRKVPPEHENSDPFPYRFPTTKCQSEIDVPLRQNECNFWPLEKMHLDLWKK